MKQDKKQHILCGIIAAIVVGFLTYLISGEVAAERNVAAGVYAALAGGFVAACVKEWCDKVYTGSWDKRDFGFTCIGVGLAMAVILVTHMLV